MEYNQLLQNFLEIKRMYFVNLAKAYLIIRKLSDKVTLRETYHSYVKVCIWIHIKVEVVIRVGTTILTISIGRIIIETVHITETVLGTDIEIVPETDIEMTDTETVQVTSMETVQVSIETVHQAEISTVIVHAIGTEMVHAIGSEKVHEICIMTDHVIGIKIDHRIGITDQVIGIRIEKVHMIGTVSIRIETGLKVGTEVIHRIDIRIITGIVLQVGEGHLVGL